MCITYDSVSTPTPCAVAGPHGQLASIIWEFEIIYRPRSWDTMYLVVSVRLCVCPCSPGWTVQPTALISVTLLSIFSPRRLGVFSRSNGSAMRVVADGQADGRYQVHYLPASRSIIELQLAWLQFELASVFSK